MIRLFLSASLQDGACVQPSPEQTRYLTGVMRLKAGEAILVFNGRDGEWRARLDSVGKRDCVLAVEAQTRVQTLPPDLDLIIALVKRGALETIVEKATELGARRIRLVTTRRTNADHTNVARLIAIATEAAEQTGRLDVPEVIAPQKLDALLDGWPAQRRLMFCDEAGDDPEKTWGGEAGRALPAPAALKDAPYAASWSVLIGPEGGFAPEERGALAVLARRHPRHARPPDSARRHRRHRRPDPVAGGLGGLAGSPCLLSPGAGSLISPKSRNAAKPRPFSFGFHWRFSLAGT